MVLQTDLFERPTYRHQYLESSCFYPYHCKKGIPSSQALRLRIYSNTFFWQKKFAIVIYRKAINWRKTFREQDDIQEKNYEENL